MVFAPDNYDAIGSCVLKIDSVKTGDCEVSSIMVLISDRVLQLAIVGLLITYARDFAASMGFHHLLVREVEDVIEGILRVVGWKDCSCKGLRGDRGTGLCDVSWAAGQDFGGGEGCRNHKNVHPKDNGLTEERDVTEEESGSSDGTVIVTEDKVINDESR